MVADLLQRLKAAPVERYAEINLSARPPTLPLCDSREADGFLYDVMLYIEGETLTVGEPAKALTGHTALH